MNSKVNCPICSKKFKSLMSHIIRKHKMKISDFKKEYPNYPLVSEKTLKTMAKASKDAGCGKWLKGKKLTREHREKISKAVSGKNNPFYGKKHTEKTKKQMSKNHADFTGEKNPFKKWVKNDDNKKKWLSLLKDAHEQRRQNSKLDKKYRERLAKQSAQAHIDGKLMAYGRGHKNGYFIGKNGHKIYYRSSYELKFLKWCESSDNIKSFRSCNFSIPYIYNKVEKRYIPDFIINNLYLIEVKPKKLIDTRQNKAKFRAGKRYCLKHNMTYIVLTEDCLGDLDKWIKNILKR